MSDHEARNGAPRSPSVPKLPPYHVVPPGTPQTKCSTCGRPLWKIKADSGSTIPVTCTIDSIETKTGRVGVPGLVPPTATSSGMGINHFVDCPQRNEHRAGHSARTMPAAPAEPIRTLTEQQQAVANAEGWARQFGIRCTGAPNLPEQCGNDGLVVLLLSDKIFATPCAAHADVIVDAVKRAGRFRDLRYWPIDRYLRGPHAQQFAEKAKRVRERNRVFGFTVPASGPLK